MISSQEQTGSGQPRRTDLERPPTSRETWAFRTTHSTPSRKVRPTSLPKSSPSSPSTSSPTPSLIIQSTACARRTKLRRCPFFDQNFKLVKSFTDKHLPHGYAPFNVQVLDGHLFVTFALQDADKHDDVAGAGHGFVDEFDLKGHLLTGWHRAGRSFSVGACDRAFWLWRVRRRSTCREFR